MKNIKRQINNLYFTSVFSYLSVTGAWVAILAARGFTLVQVGIAETVFHITSLIFEIPSGMFADIYGRKRMLVLSRIMAVIGNAVMALSDGFGMVCVSMVFIALSYNFASGTGDALAYDSLKMVEQEERYEKYFSNQMVIYRIGNAISTLCAGLALVMGYRWAYLLSAATNLIALVFTCCLEEVRVASDQRTEPVGIWDGMVKHFVDSFRFLTKNKKATMLMFANSLVGAFEVLLVYFLQAKLPEAGMSDWSLGVALFLMELGGIFGAKLILCAKKVRYGVVYAFCLFGVLMGVYLEHTGIIGVMVAGGFLAVLADDALQIRTDAKLQDMFSSEQRATLLSIASFTYSVIMIVLSPLAGYFFSVW